MVSRDTEAILASSYDNLTIANRIAWDKCQDILMVRLRPEYQPVSAVSGYVGGGVWVWSNECETIKLKTLSALLPLYHLCATARRY